MATVILRNGAKGQYYRIQVYSHDVDNQDGKLVRFSKNWPIPSDLADKASSPVKRVRERAEKEIADALAVAVKAFEDDVAAGNVKTRAQKAEQKRQAALEAEKIKTLRQFCEEVYFPQKKAVSGVSIRTIDHYAGTLKHVYRYQIADFPINEITPVMISKLYLDEKAAGTSASMIKRIDVCLRQVFDMAYKMDLCAISPMLKVTKPALSKQEKLARKKIEALTPDQLNHVLACARQDYEKATNQHDIDVYFKWYVFISLLAFSGARCGELCGLSWDNVDFENNQIVIDKHVIFTNSHGLQIEQGTKTGKNRIIPIDSEVMKLLYAFKRNQMHQDGNIFKMTKWVFEQQDGITPMSPQSPVQYLHKFSKRHALEDLKLHPHLFRHTFASLSVAGNVDIASLSANLGHAQISTTLDMYVHASLEGQQKAASIFSNLLKASRASQ